MLHPSPDSVEPLVLKGVVRCNMSPLVGRSTPLVAASVPHSGVERYSMMTMPTAGIAVAPMLFPAALFGRGTVSTGPSTNRRLSSTMRACCTAFTHSRRVIDRHVGVIQEQQLLVSDRQPHDRVE